MSEPFAYAAVDLTNAEAEALIASARTSHRIQAPELKSNNLRKRSNWPAIALDIAEQVRDRAIVVAFDKVLNLGGKAYEYLFEPVLQENSLLFYRLNLHRFVMNVCLETMMLALAIATKTAPL